MTPVEREAIQVGLGHALNCFRLESGQLDAEGLLALRNAFAVGKIRDTLRIPLLTTTERARILETIHHAAKAYAEGGRLDAEAQAALRRALLLTVAASRACVAAAVERLSEVPIA